MVFGLGSFAFGGMRVVNLAFEEGESFLHELRPEEGDLLLEVVN